MTKIVYVKGTASLLSDCEAFLTSQDALTLVYFKSNTRKRIKHFSPKKKKHSKSSFWENGPAEFRNALTRSPFTVTAYAEARTILVSRIRDRVFESHQKNRSMFSLFSVLLSCVNMDILDVQRGVKSTAKVMLI